MHCLDGPQIGPLTLSSWFIRDTGGERRRRKGTAVSAAGGKEIEQSRLMRSHRRACVDERSAEATREVVA